MPNNHRLLAGTALALVLGTATLAQESEPAPEAEAEAPAATESADAAESPEAAEAAPMSDADASTVVATVNGTEITLGQMIVARSQLPPQYQQLPPDVLFDGVLDQLVQQQLMADTVTEVPARVDYALANERRALLAGEAVNDVLTGAASEEAIAERYEADFADAEPTLEWNAGHILVPTEEEAQAVIERLEAGEDFAALAGELSQDPGSGQSGGNLGWFGPGMMVGPFEAAVAGLEPGAVSEPVETQFGWHVITLNEMREQQPPALEEISGEIAQALQQEALQARIEELTAAADIEMPEAGEFDPAVLNDLSLLDE